MKPIVVSNIANVYGDGQIIRVESRKPATTSCIISGPVKAAALISSQHLLSASHYCSDSCMTTCLSHHIIILYGIRRSEQFMLLLTTSTSDSILSYFEALLKNSKCSSNRMFSSDFNFLPFTQSIFREYCWDLIASIHRVTFGKTGDRFVGLRRTVALFRKRAQFMVWLTF